MKLSDFFQIMDKYFASQIDEKNDGGKSSLIKIQTIASWFILEQGTGAEFLPFNMPRDQASRMFSGSTGGEPRIDKCREMLSHFDEYAFRKFYDKVQPSPDCIDAIIDDFSKYGVELNDEIDLEIARCFRNILEEVVTKADAAPVSNVEFLSDREFKWRNKIYKLPEDLIIEELDSKQIYIGALLEVYSITDGLNKEGYYDLNNLPLKYREHLNVQSRDYFKAQNILHKLRDCVYLKDGEFAFEAVKEEAYDLVQSAICKAYINPLERVDQTLYLVVVASNWKSKLAKEGNGLIGGAEKRGIIHMLVDEGKIKWVRAYEQDI